LGLEKPAKQPPPPKASRALVAAGALLVAALALASVANVDGMPTMALYGVGGLAALVALGLGLYVLVSRLSPTSPELRYLAPNSRLGRGPHVTTQCEPDQVLVGSLVSMVEQLRDAAIEEHWTVDWAKFDELTATGKKAVDNRDYCTAVKNYALALHFMMGQLRNQRAAKPA
jgi:hypothetical protein